MNEDSFLETRRNLMVLAIAPVGLLWLVIITMALSAISEPFQALDQGLQVVFAASVTLVAAVTYLGYVWFADKIVTRSINMLNENK